MDYPEIPEKSGVFQCSQPFLEHGNGPSEWGVFPVPGPLRAGTGNTSLPTGADDEAILAEWGEWFAELAEGTDVED